MNTVESARLVSLNNDAASSKVAGAIQVQGVSFWVGKKTLLDQVDVSLLPGKINVILGQNGAGKTTLLHLLAKEIHPCKGRIMWGSTPLETLSLSELALKRSVLAQAVNLAFSLSVKEVVALGAHVASLDKAAAKVEAALTACDLRSLKDRDYLTLSGGEQKRTQFARVLAQIWPDDITQPHAFAGRWLLLDEWTAGLDIKHQHCLATQMQGWAKQGLGIVMIVHDLNQAAQLADHCVVLKEGKLLRSGALNEVFTRAILMEALQTDLRIEYDAATQKPFVLPSV